MSALSTVLARGTIGSRPAAGNPGRIYFSTEPKTYRDNGSSWDDVSDTTGSFALDDLTDVAKGTSFPGGASSGGLAYRTDRKLLYQYDGTRWLCACPHEAQLNPRDDISYSGISATVSVVARCLIPWKGTYSVWCESLEVITDVVTTSSGTQYWTIAYSSQTASATSLGSFDTKTDTHDVHTQHVVAVNALLNTSDVYVMAGATKTLTPGNLFFSGVPIMRFRYVG